jgi:hypothetical protein
MQINAPEGGRHPRPPSQQVSQIVWHRLHCSFARISINVPPQTGQAGRVGDAAHASGSPFAEESLVF